MDDRLNDFAMRALAAVLTVAGIVVVLIGYLGVRNQSHVELQLPYLISGGIGGLVLLGLGALVLIQYQMRVQARRFTEMTDSLDEWKDRHELMLSKFDPRVFAGRTLDGWDALVQARTGMQHAQPGWRPGPVFLHFPAPSMGACFLLASGVLAALVQRESSGRGQHVETSLHQGVLAYTTQIWQAHEKAGAGFMTMMQKSYPPGIHQSSVYECADGDWIHAATMSGRTPTRTMEDILGLEPVDMAELFRDESRRAAHDARLREAFRTRARDSLIEEFHAAGLGAEAVAPMATAFAHPQFVANGMTVTVDDKELGVTTQVGPPVLFSRTPAEVQGGQPLPGEHSRELLTESGLAPDDIDKLFAAGIVTTGATRAAGASGDATGARP